MSRSLTARPTASVACSAGPGLAARPFGCPRPFPLGLVRRRLPLRAARRRMPRASPRRSAQRPPEGDWRTWLLLGGRAAGKTRTAAELVRYWAESGQARRIGLVAPTAADYRDTMIQGPSGILAIAPPWNRPRFEPSKRRLTWPNGAIAICLSADQPERAGGLQFDRLWCDELCAWPYPSRMWETVLLCLRLGTQPRAVVTTTPRPIKLLARILDDPTTRLSRETTFANARHLAPEFISEITAMYDGTRLGQQELHAEVLDTSETVRFPGFSAARHVVEKAEYVPGLPVRLAIDCGLSRHVGALFFQVRERDGATPGSVRRIISVFADYYAVDKTSSDNARAILDRSYPVCGGRIDRVYLDPASTARSGIGPAARGEFARVLGERVTDCWPVHRVLEGLDQVEILLAHRRGSPICGSTPAASSSSRASRRIGGPSRRARSSTHRPIPSTRPRRPWTRFAEPSGPSSPRGGWSRRPG